MLTLATPDRVAGGAVPRSYVHALITCNMNRRKAYELLHINSTLRKDEWEALDSTTEEAAREILVAVQDLRDAGLVRTLSIATSIAQYSQRSLMPPPTVNMNPLSDVNMARVDFRLAGVPVPFTMEAFQIDIRTLEASRISGEGLDTVQTSEAAYQVALAWEGMTVNGTPNVAVADSGGTLQNIYGYTNHPNRVPGTATGPWNAAAPAGFNNAIATKNAMKAQLRAVRRYPPYVMYVNDDNWTDLDTTNTQTDRTAREVILADPEISMIKNAPQLASGNIVMVSLRRNVVQWAQASDIRSVEWDEKGGLGTNFRVVGVGVPLLQTDYNNRSGFAHFTGAR